MGCVPLPPLLEVFGLKVVCGCGRSCKSIDLILPQHTIAYILKDKANGDFFCHP